MVVKPDTGDYTTVPDLIYGITREIRDDRGIGGKLDKDHHAQPGFPALRERADPREPGVGGPAPCV